MISAKPGTISKNIYFLCSWVALQSLLFLDLSFLCAIIQHDLNLNVPTSRRDRSVLKEVGCTRITFISFDAWLFWESSNPLKPVITVFRRWGGGKKWNKAHVRHQQLHFEEEFFLFFFFLQIFHSDILSGIQGNVFFAVIFHAVHGLSWQLSFWSCAIAPWLNTKLSPLVTAERVIALLFGRRTPPFRKSGEGIFSTDSETFTFYIRFNVFLGLKATFNHKRLVCNLPACAPRSEERGLNETPSWRTDVRHVS